MSQRDPQTSAAAKSSGPEELTEASAEAMPSRAPSGPDSAANARAHGIAYTPGAKVECDDWSGEPSCGKGLHVSPRPLMARRYNEQATRYVQVRVKLADLVVIDDKAKAPAVTVVCECDEDGVPLEASVAA